jgi:hypothetical protein
MEIIESLSERLEVLENRTGAVRMDYQPTPKEYRRDSLRRALFVLLLLSFMLGGSWVAWPASYDFTTIDFPISVTTSAFGINNQGEIVGGYDGHGFLLSGGTFTTIDVPNSFSTVVEEIN